MAPITDNGDLTSTTNSVYEAGHVDYIDITGTVYELFESEVDLTEDPSFEQFITAVPGFDASAVAVLAAGGFAASEFNGLFSIKTDSTDLTDENADDVKFSFNDITSQIISSPSYSGAQ